MPNITGGAGRLVLSAVCLSLSGLVAAAAPADRPGRIAAALDRAVRPLLDAHDVPGIAVAVTLDGERHIRTYGVASREAKTPVTEDTLFEIGSVSKTFTATLATYAEALGKLSLDDRPGRHMAPLRGRPIDAASLFHLGTYTAGGLPLQFPDAVKGEAGTIAYFQEWNPSAPPGTQRRYSNPSIGLLGHVTALAMGGRFESLVERELFQKLGLGQSFIRVPEAQMGRYAWGYDKANRPIRVNPGPLAAEAYGVKSSAADMIRFVEANLRPESLPDPLRRAVEGTHKGYFRIGGMVQGLGWEQYPYPVALDRLLAGNSPQVVLETNGATPLTPPQPPSGATFFNKTGSTNGFGAYAAFVPAKKIGFVLLANKNLPVPARIAAAHAVLQELTADGFGGI